MDRNDLLLIMKIGILVSGIMLLIVFVTTPKTNCQKCFFEIDGEKLTMEEFLKKYMDECIEYHSTLTMNYEELDLNVSNNTGYGG